MGHPDPNNPNVRCLAALVSEITWRYVTTHTPEQQEALMRKIDEDRRLRDRLFRTPDQARPNQPAI